MALRAGARTNHTHAMETVGAPSQPRVRTAVLLAGIAFAALAVRLLWLAYHGLGEITWDGAEYARTATNLASGHGYLGLRGTTNFVFPPFYSLTIAALLPLTGDAERAGLAVSLISGALFVLPVYLLATAVFSRRTGILAASIAAVFPFVVELSTVVLAEMLFLTLVTAGLAFLVRAAQAFTVRDACLCGAACGLAYLTRPEGILIEALAVATIVCAAFGARSARRLPVLGFAVILPFAVVAAPYIAFLSSNAGHVRIEGKSFLNLDIGMRMQRGMSYAVAADAIDRDLNEVGPELRRDYYFEPRDREKISNGRIVAFAAENTLRHSKDIAKIALSPLCGTIVFAAFVLAGLLAGAWTRKRITGEAILIAYAAVVIVSLASVVQFWDRYFAGFVPIWIVFGARGIDAATLRLHLRAPALQHLRVAAPLTALFLAVCAFSTRTGFNDNSATTVEKVAGQWLAANAPPGQRVLSISDQSVYYARDVWSMLPWSPDEASALRYLKRLDPAYVVLNGEYASERPYVLNWLAAGIPDRAAQAVYTVRQNGAPALTIVRWHGEEEAKSRRAASQVSSERGG
jgi:4-amino-4-deoxy-L-arabinose transferase-like glycosyltransferase